jgi:hypothetical protein
MTKRHLLWLLELVACGLLALAFIYANKRGPPSASAIKTADPGIAPYLRISRYISDYMSLSVHVATSSRSVSTWTSPSTRAPTGFLTARRWGNSPRCEGCHAH